MRAARRPLLPPTSSLPNLRTLGQQPESLVLSALSDLYALYCPLPTALAFQTNSAHKGPLAVADSGYASGNEEEDNEDSAGDASDIRDDPYERAFAERWLTGFLGCVEEFACFETDEARERAVDWASCVLASFFSCDNEVTEEDTEITRDYHFKLNLKSDDDSNASAGKIETVTVQLTDGLAGRNSADHTDVGLQSWGAAFIFSELMCKSPARFGFSGRTMGATPRIIELGAGTGLVGIVLGKILPRLGVTRPVIITTDFHPTVLANLKSNIERNSTATIRDPQAEDSLVSAAVLNWETPDLSGSLAEPADILVATDVIYDAPHAVWLRDCAAQMLKPDGVFWLMLTVRTTGKFEGIGETARVAFNGRDGPSDAMGRALTILEEERYARPSGIGRGDESEYRLFRIGWARCEG